MKISTAQIPLFVDLDGTLIKTDVLLESILLLLRRNTLYLALLPIWLLRGRANLKYQVARRVNLPCDSLPLNPELLAYLHQERANGRQLILISASNEKPVSELAHHLDLFAEAIGSDQYLNLRAQAKLTRIRQRLPAGKFAYAGNSHADIPVWAEAAEIVLVNCPRAVVESLLERAQDILQFDTPSGYWREFIKAMRLHQWLKNGLIFLPLLLSHQLADPVLLLQAAIGFISFSLCASSVYLMNDLLDLQSDRQHRTKRLRPFACGELPLAWGFIGAPALLLAAVLTALLLDGGFLYVLLVYWAITCLYTLHLKRLFVIDAITLSILYTLRIIAGSVVIGVVTTNWLLAFSLCVFFGLAMLKRFTELNNLRAEGGSGISGRAYTTGSQRAIFTIGAISNVMAIAVFAMYINAPDITQLYSMPVLLWVICPLLLYLFARIWIQAQKGLLHEDPVMFAITDHRSQIAAALCGAIIWLAM